MIIASDGSGELVRSSHVSFSRHTINNAPTAERGAEIIDRFARAINVRQSWASSPPAGITTEQLDRVLDGYYDKTEVTL